jgi:hypothetical protein
MSRLNYLATLTPIETWRILRRRLPHFRNEVAWTGNELLSSSKHNRGIRFAELLLRQEAIARRHMPWEPLDFVDHTVLEIGCGPLAGFGPLAIFCGAKSFASADPEWNPKLFFSEPIKDRYLRMLHEDLSALYGQRMDFVTFLAALKDRLFIEICGFEHSHPPADCDIVLSQSCLEHVFPLEATVAKLAAVQGRHTRFLHLVDFGNHYPTANPFAGLYEQPPSEYIAQRGRAINLLRASDVKAMFQQAGINSCCVPTRNMAATYEGKIHPYWSSRYDVDALFTQLMIIAGPGA